MTFWLGFALGMFSAWTLLTVGAFRMLRKMGRSQKAKLAHAENLERIARDVRGEAERLQG
jgi:hypothetical protein